MSSGRPMPSRNDSSGEGMAPTSTGANGFSVPVADVTGRRLVEQVDGEHVFLYAAQHLLDGAEEVALQVGRASSSEPTCCRRRTA